MMRYLALLMLSGCAMVSPGPYTQTHVNGERWNAAQASCVSVAFDEMQRDGVPGYSSAGRILGGPIFRGTVHVQTKYVERCMEQKGFVRPVRN